MGTPAFLAPEQASGRPQDTDERTDVYALGGLLAFLLRAQAPDQPPAPLVAICDQTRAEDPTGRYPGVSELAADVTRFLDGLAVTAYPEGLWRKTRRFVRRYRVPILLVLAYLVMRVLLLVFAP